MEERRAHFVGETYDPGTACSAAGRAGRAAAELAGRGRAIRHLGSLLSPDEELSLHLFEADSAETVAEVGRLAASPFDRIWQAAWLPATCTCTCNEKGEQ